MIRADRSGPLRLGPTELYEAAADEMRERMRKRGFPLPVDKNLEQQGVAHFLYLGTPVVPEVS